MITVVCSSQYPLDEFKKHIIKTSGLDNKIEFLGYENKGEFSLTEIYNRGLKEAKNNIIVYLHNDITIETKNWGQKILKQFAKNPEYSIIGVAGTKNIPVSGQWWENPKKMYGRVAHTHTDDKGTNTWLSAYSEDLGVELEEVVIVDGVFFAVDRNKLKTNFDESVKGFHFYDVDFCFNNYLKGAKIGVSTVVRINHKSIGITNDSWNKNREIFAQKFQNELPKNIKKTLRKGEKLKVLIGCLNFNGYTGSELYVYELAKGLVKDGCDVSICSNIGNPLNIIAKQLGIKTYTLQEPPGFKLGDGKWKLKTVNGEVDSQPNTLYQVNKMDFDIIHLNHKPVTEHLARLYPSTPIICSIHSEIISLEEPVISPEIKKYIAIRPEIKKHLIEKFHIDEKIIDVVYNPIDGTRFKPQNNIQKKDKKIILFVGTIDYLRKETIKDLINKTKNDNEELWIVGKKNESYLDELLVNQDHVKYFPPTSNVEDYVKKCDETASIMLGRTLIEGWLCGKKGWIYDVDDYGNIMSKHLAEIPEDVDKFKSENVVKEIKEKYLTILD